MATGLIDPQAARSRNWAATADAGVHLALGFIPGYNAVRVGAALMGYSIHFVDYQARRPTLAFTKGPTLPQGAAGLASAYQALTLVRAELGGAVLSNLARVSPAGAVSDLLNVVSFAYDVYTCWRQR